MEYCTLNNGLSMPMLGYGTWDVRGKEGKRALLEAIDCGYRLIDTAQMYENEEIVGQAVRESGLPRGDFFLTTKLYRPSQSYEKAKRDLAISLERLQTDYVDLLLIHEPYRQAPEMYEALKEAYAAGAVRAIGVSNFNRRQYETFLQSCGVIPAVNQVESHVYYSQLKLKEFLAKHGTVMQSWGAFTEGQRPIFNDAVLRQVAERHGKTAGQIALGYLLRQGIPVIPKSSHRERMEENMDVFDFTLGEEDRKEIAALDEGRSLFNWYCGDWV